MFYPCKNIKQFNFGILLFVFFFLQTHNIQYIFHFPNSFVSRSHIPIFIFEQVIALYEVACTHTGSGVPVRMCTFGWRERESETQSRIPPVTRDAQRWRENK